MTFTLGAIWAQTIDGVIGRDGVMPWHVPEDLQHFKEATSGKPVIMGRRTWESLPDAYKPLPGRTNIVVSRSVDTVEARDGGIWVSSLDAALEVAHKAQEATNADSLADAWVIGGGTLHLHRVRHRRCFNLPGDVHERPTVSGTLNSHH